MSEERVTEVFPLLYSDDVAALADWAIRTLEFSESWRAPGPDGLIEHAELLGFGGKISVNIRHDPTVPRAQAGIGLRIDDSGEVERLYAVAKAAGAEIVNPLATSRVSFSFTVRDIDGNEWWVHAETGFLDQLRGDGNR